MFTLTQMHIEAARNSTDDFNLFHDKNRWNKIEDNPFKGPIALGFQLGCFIEYQTLKHRSDEENTHYVHSEKFGYSAYEFSFAGIVKPDDKIELNIKKGRLSEVDGVSSYSNRIALKANGRPVIMGFKRECNTNTIPLPHALLPGTDWRSLKDRHFIGDSGYFYKRKFMIVGNAKNFLTSAFAEQSEYIDEFADKVCFPDMYPLGLISSALLERAQALQHDLIKNPMIYASHKLCVNKAQIKQLRSNDALNILVGPEVHQNDSDRITQTCFGFVNHKTPLFAAQIQLLPLKSLL